MSHCQICTLSRFETRGVFSSVAVQWLLPDTSSRLVNSMNLTEKYIYEWYVCILPLLFICCPASSHAVTLWKRACQSSVGRAMWFQVLTVSVGLVFQSGVAMATVTINQYRMTAVGNRKRLNTLAHFVSPTRSHTQSQMGGNDEKGGIFCRAKWQKRDTLAGCR